MARPAGKAWLQRLRDGRKGKPSFRRVPLATCQEVLRLYQEKYFDLNVQHFHEKLRELHGIQLSYSWVKQALQGAGLVAPKCPSGTSSPAGSWSGWRVARTQQGFAF